MIMGALTVYFFYDNIILSLRRGVCYMKIEKTPEQWIDDLQKFTGYAVRSVKNSTLAKFFTQQCTNEKFEKILNSKKCQIVGVVLVAGALLNTAQNLDEIAISNASKYAISVEETGDWNDDSEAILPQDLNSLGQTLVAVKKSGKTAVKSTKQTNADELYIDKSALQKIALSRGIKQDIFESNWETFKKARKLLLPLNLYFENVSDTVYLDVGGTPTIAAGMTYYPNGKRVKMGDRDISQTLSQDLIDEHGSYSQATLAKMRYYTEYHDDVEVFKPLLISLKTKVSEKEMTVLGSLISNRGSGRILASKMMEKLNAGKPYEKNLLAFNFDKNRTWRQGLQTRRAIEYLILNDKIDLKEVMNFPIAGGYGKANFALLYDVKKVQCRAGAINIPRTDKATINKFLQRQKVNLPKVKDKIDNKTVKNLQNFVLAQGR